MQIDRKSSMLIFACPPTLTPRSKAMTTVIRASLLQRKNYGLAGCRRGASGVENFGNDEVGFERGEAVRLCAIENDGAQLG